MSTVNLTKILNTAPERLSQLESLKEIFHQHRDGNQHHSGKSPEETIEHLRSILFSGCCAILTANIRTIMYQFGVNFKNLHRPLSRLTGAVLCIVNPIIHKLTAYFLRLCKVKANIPEARMSERKPAIRFVLATGAETAYACYSNRLYGWCQCQDKGIHVTQNSEIQ